MLQNRKGGLIALLIGLFCFTVIAHATPSTDTGLNQPLNPSEIPEEISTGDWASIQAQIKADMYKTYADDISGFKSINPAHDWQIHYAADGTTTLTSRDRESLRYHLSLRLSAIGYQTQGKPLTVLQRPQDIKHKDNTLDYHWTNRLTERWINSEADLEQWFFIKQRLPGATSGQPLTLQLTLDSDLSISQQNNTLRFSNPSGTTITYNKLKVWDATGRELSAQMQLAGQHLSLMVDDSAAHYPLTIDPSFQQPVRLDGIGSVFGNSVAISGDTLIVGASESSPAGAAHIFTRNGNTWTLQASLEADGSDGFGYSVDITGDTIVVGDPSEDSNTTGINSVPSIDSSYFNSGAAYIFTRSGNTWTQQAYLKASNAEADDSFGESVAISGDTVVVSSREDSNATGINGDQSDNSINSDGAVYVFTRSGSTWTQQAYLKSPNSASDSIFGSDSEHLIAIK